MSFKETELAGADKFMDPKPVTLNTDASSAELGKQSRRHCKMHAAHVRLSFTRDLLFATFCLDLSDSLALAFDFQGLAPRACRSALASAVKHPDPDF